MSFDYKLEAEIDHNLGVRGPGIMKSTSMIMRNSSKTLQELVSEKHADIFH